MCKTRFYLPLSPLPCPLPAALSRAHARFSYTARSRSRFAFTFVLAFTFADLGGMSARRQSVWPGEDRFPPPLLAQRQRLNHPTHTPSLHSCTFTLAPYTFKKGFPVRTDRSRTAPPPSPLLPPALFFHPRDAYLVTAAR